MALKVQFILVFSFLVMGPFALQANTPNPFFSNQESTAAKQNKAKAAEKRDSLLNNRFTSGIYLKLIQFQRSSNQKISEIITNYRDQKSSDLLWYVLIIALSYGFFHAMMPGHGKNIILGWILSSQKRFKKVVFTSTLAMILHVFSAVVIVYAVWFLIGGRISTQTTQLTRYLSFFACAILLYLAVNQIIEAFWRGRRRHSHFHDHQHQLESIQNQTTWKECVFTATSIGLIPCPVSSILMVFMISQGFHYEGILTGLFFAIGMAGTMLIFSSLAWYTRSLLLNRQNMVFVRVVEYGLPVLGSSLMIFAALILVLPHL